MKNKDTRLFDRDAPLPVRFFIAPFQLVQQRNSKPRPRFGGGFLRVIRNRSGSRHPRDLCPQSFGGIKRQLAPTHRFPNCGNFLMRDRLFVVGPKTEIR